MIELFGQNIMTNRRQSSKGNQLKWENDGIWYKADYTGYEGLAEYMISHLLKKSTLAEQEFVCYDLEEIKYGTVIYNGAKSKNFLNEDRHMHNIAVLMNGKGDYAYCPIFDNGAGLLADITMDYPLTGDIYTLMEKVQPKTICNAFDEQLDISESLYKMNLKFRFTKKDVTELLENAEGYSDEIRKRVETIIFAQMRKYPYLFSKM